MVAAGRSPATSGRRGRRGGRGWSKPRKKPPPSPLTLFPEAAAVPAAAARQYRLGPLPPGTEVEVRVDEDGFYGSWFEATVVDFSPARGTRVPARYAVTYSHLLADEGGGVLAEHFAPSHIRPRPPPPPSPSPPLRLHDIVEAFHNDGWWSGIVVAAPDPAAPDSATVTVAFPITREVIAFPPRLVRPRRDFVAGEWVPSLSVVAVWPKRALKAYDVGEKVEVGRDREVFGYSWFPATVVKVVDSLSYVVEYFDQEVEGDAGMEKATEYLHWSFIRPAVEHVPRDTEFQLGPGAAVEAYCDGAWSPGIVSSVVDEDEYEVSVDGKKGEVLVIRVVELLKPQYKWNGKQWRIVNVKRRANLRRRSISGSTSTPIYVASSGDEQSHDHGSSAIKKLKTATKRPRKEPQQQELILAEDLVDVSISERDIPLTALHKSERNHSLLSGKNNLEVIADSIGQTVINKKILSEVSLDCQLNTPTCGTGAGNGCDKLSVAEPRKKMASTHTNSAVQQTQERLHTVKVKKGISNNERGKTHPIQELQGKHDASHNVQSQLIKNGNLQSKEIICALTVPVDFQASSMPNKQMSRQTRSAANTKAPTYKRLAKKKRSKEPSTPHGTLDADSTVQYRGRGRENSMSISCCTQQDLERSLEDTYQELDPLLPSGFESMYNAEGDSLSHKKLTSGICQANRNGGVSTDHADIQVAKSSHLMDASVLSLDRPIQQGHEHFQNAGSSHSSVDNSLLRSFSLARCSIVPHFTTTTTTTTKSLATSQISGDQVPFVKKSPVWSQVEGSDVFKLAPQKPHFLPLQEYPLSMREGMALGMMMAFVTIVENVRKASIEDGMEFFEDMINTLHYLAANGFNVQFLQNRVIKLLQLKSDCAMYHREISKLEIEMVGKTTSLSRMDESLNKKEEAIGELEQQLLHLRQETQQLKKDREHEDAGLSRLKSKCSRFDKAYGEAKLQFWNVLHDLRRERLL